MSIAKLDLSKVVQPPALTQQFVVIGEADIDAYTSMCTNTFNEDSDSFHLNVEHVLQANTHEDSDLLEVDVSKEEPHELIILATPEKEVEEVKDAHSSRPPALEEEKDITTFEVHTEQTELVIPTTPNSNVNGGKSPVS